MKPILRAVSLTKVYESEGVKTPALRGVDLEVAPGEFTAIAGPSGSGKSTLCTSWAASTAPTAGETWLGQRRTDQLDAVARAHLRLREIGFVFQAYNLIPVLTALENAAFVLELRGVPKKERHEKAMAALEALGIADWPTAGPTSSPAASSSGWRWPGRWRPSPGWCWPTSPRPTWTRNGLALIELMKQLNAERGITFLFSTHDPRLLEHVNRIVRLEDGRLVADERVA